MYEFNNHRRHFRFFRHVFSPVGYLRLGRAGRRGHQRRRWSWCLFLSGGWLGHAHGHEMARQVQRVLRVSVLCDAERRSLGTQAAQHSARASRASRDLVHGGAPSAHHKVCAVNGFLNPSVVADHVHAALAGSDEIAWVGRAVCEEVDHGECVVPPPARVFHDLAQRVVILVGVRRARVEHDPADRTGVCPRDSRGPPAGQLVAVVAHDDRVACDGQQRHLFYLPLKVSKD